MWWINPLVPPSGRAGTVSYFETVLGEDGTVLTELNYILHSFQTPKVCQTPVRWRRWERRFTLHWKLTVSRSTLTNLEGTQPVFPFLFLRMTLQWFWDYYITSYLIVSHIIYKWISTLLTSRSPTKYNILQVVQ